MTARILLAEDNESLAALLQKFLTDRGFAVQSAGNGLEALQQLAAHSFDLLILDLRLPVLSGIDLLQKLRTTPRGKTLPVVIITGIYRGEKYAEAVRRLGVTHYLEKPFKPDLFLNAVQSALQEANLPKSPMDLVIDIYNSGRTGLLTIGAGSPIAFLKGNPIGFISHGREDFPAFLAARGKISAGDARLFVSQGEGRIFFTQAGILSYDDLLEESRLFLASRLNELLDLPAGGKFIEQPPEVEFPLTALSLPRFLYETVKTGTHNVNAEEFCTNFALRYPARTRRFYRRANLLNMRQEDILLLSRIDGQTPLAAIIAESDRQEAAQFIHFLLALDMITMLESPGEEAAADFPLKNLFNRPLEESRPIEERSVDFGDLVAEVSAKVELVPEGMDAPLSTGEIDSEQAILREFSLLKDKDYYEIFGLTQSTFSFNALKDAYFARTRQYSPERFMELSGSSQNTAQEILSVYANAYNTLSNVVSKERYDEMLNANTVGLAGKQDDKLQAQVQFQSGKVFLEMEEFDNAEKALHDAYTLEPDNAQHCAYLAWAIYRNPASKNSRTALDKARTLLSKSLQYDKSAEAFAFRGWMLLDEGRDGLAEGEFQKALRLNPQERNARRGLRLIEEKREAEKKGVFRRFFG